MAAAIAKIQKTHSKCQGMITDSTCSFILASQPNLLHMRAAYSELRSEKCLKLKIGLIEICTTMIALLNGEKHKVMT